MSINDNNSQASSQTQAQVDTTKPNPIQTSLAPGAGLIQGGAVAAADGSVKATGLNTLIRRSISANSLSGKMAAFKKQFEKLLTKTNSVKWVMKSASWILLLIRCQWLL